MIALAALALSAQAADISLTGGDWSETIHAGDLIAGAGSDLRSPIESGGAEFQLSISNTGGAGWTVRLRRDVGTWPGDVYVEARRTTDGSGAGSIGGGSGYQTITGLDQTLFTGSGDRIGIGVQLKVTGFYVRRAPDGYGTTLTYSVD